MLQVSDNGPGIGTEDGKHIFEPFYTRKKMGHNGTGLGLTVVWNTVREHGGEISVFSESGRGATFTIYLPATPELIICVPPQEIDQARLMGRGESILVVDDEPRQREIAEKILTSLGYRVRQRGFGRGRHRLSANPTGRPAAVGHDHEPASLNGHQTFAEIIKFRPEQKALIVSGFSNSEDVESALDAGAGKFIKKPYLLRQLAQPGGNRWRADFGRRAITTKSAAGRGSGTQGKGFLAGGALVLSRLLNFFGFGALWSGPYLMQVHGLSRAQSGAILSMIA